jgi:uncharacterized cupin superfamily protein
MSAVTITRPSAAELADLGVERWSPWSCEPSTFDWEYDAAETAYVDEGLVEVTIPGEVVTIRGGDLVTFAAGLKCTWRVLEPIRKRYTFR